MLHFLVYIETQQFLSQTFSERQNFSPHSLLSWKCLGSKSPTYFCPCKTFLLSTCDQSLGNSCFSFSFARPPISILLRRRPTVASDFHAIFNGQAVLGDRVTLQVGEVAKFRHFTSHCPSWLGRREPMTEITRRPVRNSKQWQTYFLRNKWFWRSPLVPPAQTMFLKLKQKGKD